MSIESCDVPTNEWSQAVLWLRLSLSMSNHSVPNPLSDTRSMATGAWLGVDFSTSAESGDPLIFLISLRTQLRTLRKIS